MSKRDPVIALVHMLEAAREAIEIAAPLDRAKLTDDRIRQHALIRLVTLVGEAASRVPREERSKLAILPWEDIVGMRNKLIHGYDEVDLDVLWAVIQQDLPDLVERLQRSVDGVLKHKGAFRGALRKDETLWGDD